MHTGSCLTWPLPSFMISFSTMLQAHSSQSRPATLPFLLVTDHAKLIHISRKLLFALERMLFPQHLDKRLLFLCNLSFNGPPSSRPSLTTQWKVAILILSPLLFLQSIYLKLLGLFLQTVVYFIFFHKIHSVKIGPLTFLLIIILFTANNSAMHIERAPQNSVEWLIIGWIWSSQRR